MEGERGIGLGFGMTQPIKKALGRCGIKRRQTETAVTQEKQEGNVLLEPAAPMFHLFIFGNVSIKKPKVHEIQKSVNTKNP